MHRLRCSGIFSRVFVTNACICATTLQLHEDILIQIKRDLHHTMQLIFNQESVILRYVRINIQNSAKIFNRSTSNQEEVNLCLLLY